MENHKAKVFLSNAVSDPMDNHKATKPAFNVGQLSARQRIVISFWIRAWPDVGLSLLGQTRFSNFRVRNSHIKQAELGTLEYCRVNQAITV